MFQAKASMDEVITLLENIGFHKKLPIVGKIIGVYFEFFKMTTGIMEKVRNYALQIIDEAEKAYNEWMKSEREKHTAWAGRLKASIYSRKNDMTNDKMEL